MRSVIISLGALGLIGTAGCAGAPGFAEKGQLAFAVTPSAEAGISAPMWGAPEPWGATLRAGKPRVLDAEVRPRGAPIVISPSGVDVMGVPRLATVDLHRVIAVFPAMIAGSYKLITLPLDGT